MSRGSTYPKVAFLINDVKRDLDFAFLPSSARRPVFEKHRNIKEINEAEEVVRTKSTLLGSLSWNTGIINSYATFSGRLIVDSRLKLLLANIDDQDKILLSSSAWTHSDGLQLQKYIGIQVSMIGTRSIVHSIPHGLANINGPWAARLFSTLSGYYLADVLALLGDRHPYPAVMQRTQILECKLPYYNHLGDWVKLLSDLDTTLKREKTFTNPSPMGAVHIQLMRCLSRLGASHKRQKITMNWLAAATHLAFLNSHQCRGSWRKLPESATVLAELDSDELTADDVAFLRSFDTKVANFGALRNALHYALAISPLCLLLPTILSQRSLNHKTLIEMNIALGNQKPPALLEVEKVIWQGLFAMASGDDPNKVLLDVSKQVSLKRLNSLPLVERQWFKLSAPSPATQQPIPLLPSPLVDVGQPAGDQETLISHMENATSFQDVSMANPQASEQEAEDEHVLSNFNIETSLPLSSVVSPTGETSLLHSPAVSPTSETSPPLSPAVSPTDDQAPSLPIASRRSIRLQHTADNPPQPISKSPSKDKSRKRKHISLERAAQEGGHRVLGFDRDHPIEVDELMDLFPIKQVEVYKEKESFISKDSAKKERSDQLFRVYRGHDEEYVVFNPVAHIQDDVEKMDKIMHAVVEGYEVQGNQRLPRHLVDSNNSAIRVMTHSAFEKKTGKQVLEILRTQNIMITGVPDAVGVSTPTFNFDEAGFKTICRLKDVIEIHDLSIDVDNREPIPGTVQDLLDAAHAADGKILNALEFPQEHAGWVATPKVSSDRVAWAATTRLHDKESDLYPVRDMFWGLGCTAGAYTWWHIDSNGLLTFVDVKCGEKIWIFIYDINGQFQRTCAFEDFQMDDAGPYRIEAILLRPGTRLLMKPNTVHMVFTPSNTICHGGHFYSRASMQDTHRGIVHSFVNHFQITNTNHVYTGRLLRRIASFYHMAFVKNGEDGLEADEQDHLPDVEQKEGFLDFLSLCFLNICGNVMDFRTYRCPNSGNKTDQEVSRLKFDVNDIDVGERVSMCQARGMCLELLRWWTATYVAVPPRNSMEETNETLDHITSNYLAQEGFKIFQYRSDMEAKDASLGPPICAVNDLIHQLANVMALDNDAAISWNQAAEEFKLRVAKNQAVGPFIMAYVEGIPGQWKIEKREVPLHFEPTSDPFYLGITDKDRHFFDFSTRKTHGSVGDPITTMKRVRSRA